MTISERWGGFSDEIPPGDGDPWGGWLKVVVIVLFILLVISLLSLLPERP